MDNKLIMLLNALLILILLSSCSNNSKPNQNSEKVIFETSLNIHIDKNLSVNAEIKTPQKDSYSTFNANVRILSPDEVIESCFADNCDVELQKTGDDEYFISADEETAYFSCYLKQFSTKFYKKQLTLINVLNTDFQPKHITYAYPIKFGNYVMRDELISLKKGTAIKRAKKFLDSLKVNVKEEPDYIYAFDKKVLKEMQEKVIQKVDLDYLKASGSDAILDEITKNDEFYYMLWSVKVEDEGFLDGNYNRGEVDGLNEITIGTTILVAMNSEKILATNISRLYEVTSKASDYNVLLPMDNILATIRNKYRNTILTSELVFSEVKFCYAPRVIDFEELKYEIVPAWSFFAEYDNARGDAEAIIVTINAITGEVIN